MEKEHAAKCKTNDINMLSGGIVLKRECDCDGYHTFDELYDHRITIYIALCNTLARTIHGHVWRSKTHSDGTVYTGWFILGINMRQGKQITYHIPISRWNETYFAVTKAKAPAYDGHTSQDVLDRLKLL